MATDTLMPSHDAASSATVPSMTIQAYTREDVAEQLQCSIATVSRMIGLGQLRSIKVGRGVRIPKEALEALMNGDRQPEHLNPHKLESNDYTDGVETPSMLAEAMGSGIWHGNTSKETRA